MSFFDIPCFPSPKGRLAFYRRTFALVPLVLAALAGCQQIPSTKPNLGAGMGEYVVDDAEIQEEWRRAAAGSDARRPKNAVKTTRVNPSQARGSSSEAETPSRFSLVKRFFAGSSSSAKNSPRELPAETVSPVRPGPIEEALAEHSKGETTETAGPLGRTVPLDGSKRGESSSEKENSSVAAGSNAPSEPTYKLPPVPNIKLTGNASSQGAANVQPVAYFEKLAEGEAGFAQSEPTPVPIRLNETPLPSTGALPSAALAVPLSEAETARQKEYIAATPLASLVQCSAESLPASTGPNTDQTWRTEAQKAIELLRAEIDRKTADGTISASEQARLRLLLLSTGNIPDAAARIAGTEPALADFWEKQCRGLGVLLESDGANDPAEGRNKRLAAAASELDGGLLRLKTACPITIPKALFVEESAPFGLYRVRPAAFRPGQTAFVYMELDNVVSRPLQSGHEIAVLCRWELLDASGRPAFSAQEQLCESRSESPLKDVVLNISVKMPETLPAGDYRLRVVLTDRNGAASDAAEETLPLKIAN